MVTQSWGDPRLGNTSRKKTKVGSIYFNVILHALEISHVWSALGKPYNSSKKGLVDRSAWKTKTEENKNK